MISTSGHRLMDKDAEQTLQKELFPLAEVITPNIQKLKRSPDCRSQMLTLWKKLLTNFMKAFTFLSF